MNRTTDELTTKLIGFLNDRGWNRRQTKYQADLYKDYLQEMTRDHGSVPRSIRTGRDLQRLLDDSVLSGNTRDYACQRRFSQRAQALSELSHFSDKIVVGTDNNADVTLATYLTKEDQSVVPTTEETYRPPVASIILRAWSPRDALTIRFSRDGDTVEKHIRRVEGYDDTLQEFGEHFNTTTGVDGKSFTIMKTFFDELYC